jgi:hypothetical protein
MSILGQLVVHKRKFGRFKFTSFFNQSHDLARRRRRPSCDGTLIESVDYNVDWDLFQDSEHLHETRCKSVFSTGSLGARMMMCGVQGKKNGAERIRLIAELDKDR